MASTRLPAPMRGVTYQLRRLSICPNESSLRSLKLPGLIAARSIATSSSPKASVSSITTSTDSPLAFRPLHMRTVLATIHQFPSLEPLWLREYPANHLDLPTRRDILHRAVIYEGDNTRSGTASTKTRYEVRGSRRKVRPQKGTGRARLGDARSPTIRSGGVAFGPRPRDFSSGIQKKVYDLAWRTALSYRFRKGELVIVENAIEIESPSTRLLEDVFKYHEKVQGRGRSLMVTLESRPLLERALLDMDRQGQSLTWMDVDVKDLLERSYVIIERHALDNILLMHQEDLTHTPMHPWHSSIVRSSVPRYLESIVGWKEFRNLSCMDPKEADVLRPKFYESVATSRYSFAATLPESPKRNELSASAYRLNAEARELLFAQKTGLPFQEYSKILSRSEDSFDPMLFPRIQALTYQMMMKNDLASKAAETSREKGEELMIEIKKVEIQKLDIQYHASLLAAEVHEHLAEAQVLEGEAEIAEITLDQASQERINVDNFEVQILEARIDLAKQNVLVSSLKKDASARQNSQNQVDKLTAELDAKIAEIEALGVGDAEFEEIVEEPEAEPIVEPKKEPEAEPIVEPKKDEKK